MRASLNGHHEVVGTLSEGGADVNAKDKVRNEMMMVIMIILLTISMMIVMMTNMLIIMIVSV